MDDGEVYPFADQRTGEILERVPVQARPVPIWEWNKAIMAAPEITKTTLAVAFALGTFADAETGESVFPAAETIGQAVGLHRTKVYAHLSILARLGYISRTGLDTKATSYRLSLPK